MLVVMKVWSQVDLKTIPINFQMHSQLHNINPPINYVKYKSRIITRSKTPAHIKNLKKKEIVGSKPSWIHNWGDTAVQRSPTQVEITPRLSTQSCESIQIKKSYIKVIQVWSEPNKNKHHEGFRMLNRYVIGLQSEEVGNGERNSDWKIVDLKEINEERWPTFGSKNWR